MAWKLHYIARLERVQKRFVMLVGTEMGMRYRECSTDHLIRLLDLQPLNTRTWSSFTDCSALLTKIILRIQGLTTSTDSLVHTEVWAYG